MGSKIRACFPFPLFMFLMLHFSSATDTLSIGHALSGNQKLVSKGGNFELGFFTPGNSQNFYIGIWYKKAVSKQTVIWVANRERPISNTSSSQLKISQDGNLVLLSHLRTLVWSSNSTASISNPTAVLLDTGNLVLRDHARSTAVGWQSFDHPTDTWVPGGRLGVNKITGEYQSLTSWKSTEDPSPGYFSYTIDPKGTSELFLLWNQSNIYWRTGVWNGHYFSAAAVLPTTPRTSHVNVSYVDDDQGRYTTCNVFDFSVITRTVLDVTGKLKLWVWHESGQDWLLVWSQPLGQCDVYAVCGAFGVCDPKSLSSCCECVHGFEPSSRRDWALNGWSSGCVRRTRLRCEDNNSSSMHGENDGFSVMHNMLLPSDAQSLAIVSNPEGCRSACLDNCSCTAYGFNGSGCWIWTGGLWNLQQLDKDDSRSGTLYVRLAASDLPSLRGKNKKAAAILKGCAGAGAIVILCLFLGLAWRSLRTRIVRVENLTIEGFLTPFAYSNLQHMTKNFSEKLGGGGFGSVFKGTLPDSTAIAVKKLEGVAQGEKQFRTELATLGLLQHANLVRLRGFCCEGTERMLVYDYMPNGSLDRLLFGNESNVLDWKTRHRIIVGIARGLAYLHEECRGCIIHCDVKPENILLDSNLCPKLADFGMAKLIGHDLSRVLTTMRGTVGYLAPEWITGSAITPKADVYSFGMMVFELVSGRRNIGFSDSSRIEFLPVFAATAVIDVAGLLDRRLEGNAGMEELTRVCRIACWCIQDCEAHRPSMKQIVQILEGGLEVNVPPVPRSLQHLVQG